MYGFPLFLFAFSPKTPPKICKRCKISSEATEPLDKSKKKGYHRYNNLTFAAGVFTGNHIKNFCGNTGKWQNPYRTRKGFGNL